MMLWTLVLSGLVLGVIVAGTSDGLFATTGLLKEQQRTAAKHAKGLPAEYSDVERAQHVEDAREERAHRRLRQLAALLLVVPFVAQLVILVSFAFLGGVRLH